MKASIVDLRYKRPEILAAIKRREVVNVEYRRRRIAKIIPHDADQQENLLNHEFFGSAQSARKSVYATVRDLRKRRYRDL